MRLPRLKYRDNVRKYEQVKFGGIDRRKGAADGSIYDLVDITTDDYPTLSTVKNKSVDEETHENVWYYGMADKPFMIKGKFSCEKYSVWEPGKYYRDGEEVIWADKLFRRYYGEITSEYDETKAQRTPPMYARSRWEAVKPVSVDVVFSEGACYKKNNIIFNDGLRFRSTVDMVLFEQYKYYENNDLNWETAGEVGDLFPDYRGEYASTKVYYLGDIVCMDENSTYHYYKVIDEPSPGGGVMGYAPYAYSDNSYYTDQWNNYPYWHEIERPWKVWNIGNNYKIGDIVVFKEDVANADNVKLYETCRKNVTGINYNNVFEPYTCAKLYYDGKAIEGLELEATKKVCVYFNDHIIIYPDKKYYNVRDGSFGYLKGDYDGIFVTWNKYYFYNRTRLAPTYSGNEPCLYLSTTSVDFSSYKLRFFLRNSEDCITGCSGHDDTIWLGWTTDEMSPVAIRDDTEDGNLSQTYYSFKDYFKDGDVVEIKDSELESYSHIKPGYYVIREVGHHYLRFDSGTFSIITRGEKTALDIGMRFIKDVPEMNCLCVSNNRIWGAGESTVYSSALGNPFIWQSYTGLENDASYFETGTPGDFVACCEYSGYPYFFKENEMYRIYGNTLSQFGLQKLADVGVSKKSPDSLCVVNSLLMFHSPFGIYAYSGGVPARVSDELNDIIYDCIASTDGFKYYAAMTVGNEKRLYVYDINLGIWSSEHLEGDILGFARYDNELRCLNAQGELYTLSGVNKTDGRKIKDVNNYAVIEFNDFYGGDIGTKDVGRIIIRVSVDPQYNALYTYIQYDSDGIWHQIGKIYNQNTNKKVCEFGFFPRKCDHFRLKFMCMGKFSIYSIAREITNNG